MLLFDANLSPRLVGRLAEDFPMSVHVEVIGLRATDEEIWRYAIGQRLTIVTKDSDFVARAALYGPPGKVIVLTTGNCRTSLVENVLRFHKHAIHLFITDESESILYLP